MGANLSSLVQRVRIYTVSAQQLAAIPPLIAAAGACS
jgi:hypothetical protein